MSSADGKHIMYMDKIMNDCHLQHYKQMEQVQKTRGKMVTNTSGFGLQGKTANLQILPLEAPEYIGIIALAFAAYLIGVAL
jgi:hypothetical protein